MSDWDASDSDEPKIVIPVKKSWDDEDLEDVKDTWEDSDEEETKVVAPKKKVPLAQKIAEREARLKEEKSKKESASKLDDELTSEELRARREEQKRLQEEADIQNAADLFSGINIKEKTNPEPLENTTAIIPNKLDALAEVNPQTKGDFDKLQVQLSELILKYKGNKNYPGFVENLVRNIVEPLKDVDVRKIASNATASANAKQKAAKDALKGKKKGLKKSNVRVEADDVGLSASRAGYDDDDYDDFM